MTGLRLRLSEEIFIRGVLSVMLTVLVVEDEVLINMGIVSMLEDLGHKAIDAYSGQEALARLNSLSGIDLVITDLGMPGMSGMELAKSIQVTWPNLPVILATGYTEAPNGEKSNLPKLTKPFSQEDLAAAIKGVMAKFGR
jgi:CheY-like chemotaxis protein